MVDVLEEVRKCIVFMLRVEDVLLLSRLFLTVSPWFMSLPLHLYLERWEEKTNIDTISSLCSCCDAIRPQWDLWSCVRPVRHGPICGISRTWWRRKTNFRAPRRKRRTGRGSKRWHYDARPLCRTGHRVQLRLWAGEWGAGRSVSLQAWRRRSIRATPIWWRPGGRGCVQQSRLLPGPQSPSCFRHGPSDRDPWLRGPQLQLCAGRSGGGTFTITHHHGGADIWRWWRRGGWFWQEDPWDGLKWNSEQRLYICLSFNVTS